MVEENENLIKCHRCPFKAPSNDWELKLLGERFVMCLKCRENRREYYYNQTEEAREILLAKAAKKYATDDNWRRKRISDVVALRTSKIKCSECGKLIQYGSLLAHKKC
mgnify:CR=1 FL=1